MDVINLHQQAGDIIARRLLDSSTGNEKMHAMIGKFFEQLDIAHMALHTQTNQTKELEEIFA